MRMKTLRTLLTIFIILFLFGCKKESTLEIDMTDSLTQVYLQGVVDQLLTDYKAKYPGYPGGLAMKVISKKGTWFVASGMPAGTTSKVHFRAASNTKSFTATAIVLLAQRGKLNLNAQITDTIPGTNMTYVPLNANYAIPYLHEITINQLLHHKAGVFDVSNNVIPDTVSVPVPYKGKDYISYVEESDSLHTFTFDEMVGVNATCRLFFFPPGTGYHYSNTGYSILGKIIERVSGQSYSEFVQSNIIVPMRMSNSSMPYLGSDRELPSPFARGYLYSGDVTDVTVSNISANVAEGNLITTPDDLASYLRSLIRGEGVLNSYSVNSLLLAPMVPPDTMANYYCGLLYTTNLGFGHTGAHEGYLSQMATDPENDFTVVVFTNAWNTTGSGLTTIGEQFTVMLTEACYRAKYAAQ
jgi:D-alanyl-D-alanine carboxypeptidase